MSADEDRDRRGRPVQPPKHPLLRRRWAELGYRSTDQLIFGLLWAGFGLSILVNGDPDPTHKVPLEYLGTPIRSGVWFVAAALAIGCSLVRDHDWIGFSALMVPVALRVFSYGFAWLYGISPWGAGSPLGDSGAWLDALIWSVIMLIIYRAAMRPELPDLPDDDGRWPWQ